MSAEPICTGDPVADVLRTADPELMREVRTVLREYERPGNLRPLLRLAGDWLAIAGAMSLWLVLPYLPWLALKILVYLFAVAVISGRLRALESCTHEATHNALFKTRSWNTTLQFLYAWPFFDQIEAYRREHMIHHRKLGQPEDPAQEMFDELKVQEFPKRFLWTMFIRPFLGYHTIWFVQSRLANCRLSRVYTLQMICFWGPILALVTWFHAWTWFALFYLVPLFLVLPALIVLSEVTDHAATNRLCPIGGNRNNIGFLQSFFIHPHNDGYHVVHHINARVPGHCLRQAHERLMQIPRFRELCVESRSYTETMRQLRQGHV